MRYDEQLDILNRQDLRKVMDGMGFASTGEDNTRAYFVCPFHEDHNPSFSVSLTPPKGYQYNAFMCHVCGKKGAGAVRLVQELLKKDGRRHEHLQLDAMLRVADICGITMDIEYTTEVHHEEFVDDDYRNTHNLYTHNYSSIRREGFTESELRSLGITPSSDTSLDGILHDQFHCYAITDCRYADDGGTLHHNWSTEDYPMFEFDYGHYIRKYEPNYIAKPGRPNYKNAYFSEVGFEVGSDAVYGDQSLLDMLELGEVNLKTARAVVDAKRLGIDEETGKQRMLRTKVLKSVVICSGQKDAINVYLNSDAHVVYPHSETSNRGLSRELIDTLLRIADRVYVLFDCDDAGVRAQNALCLRHLELRPVRLPSDLRTMVNSRGRKCKDVTEYLTVYCQKRNIQPRFAMRQLLMQSKSLKFWDAKVQRHRTEEQGEYDYESKFTFDAKSMARFLDACGFRGIWRKNSNGVDDVMGYMHIGPYTSQDLELPAQQVNMIQLEDGYDYAVRIIQNFLMSYNLTDEEAENLENALLTQRKVSDSAFRLSVSHAILDVTYWIGNRYRDAVYGEHWLFCRNKALAVTKDEIRMVDYRNVPFMVNSATVCDIDVYQPTKEIASMMPRFEVNPEYLDNKAAYEAKMGMRTCSPEERRQMTKTFTDYERLYKYRRVSDDYGRQERYPIFRIEEATTRLYWEKEEDGMLLTQDERQMQDMLLRNRMNNIGYLLVPYRTRALIQSVVFVDYKAMSRDDAAGGTGKSTIIDMLGLVCPVYVIRGATMKIGDQYPKNFDNYVDGLHRIVAHDDPPQRFQGDSINGWENGIEVKSLYKDTVKIPFEQSPKNLFCTNFMHFDMSKSATFRRVAICPVSDYFHPSDQNGTRRERNYMTEYGHDPVKQASDDELNAIVWYFAECIRLYLQEERIMEIPVDSNMRSRYTSASIESGEFIAWAQQWFQQDCHFCRPIAITEMQLSFAKWTNGEDLRGEVVRRGRNQFMENVEKYIRACGIQRLGLENVAIRGRANGTAKYPDRNCWVTPELNGFYQPDSPRIIRQADCCYFYRDSDKIPLHSKDVLTCGETDPEINI